MCCSLPRYDSTLVPEAHYQRTESIYESLYASVDDRKGATYVTTSDMVSYLCVCVCVCVSVCVCVCVCGAHKACAHPSLLPPSAFPPHCLLLVCIPSGHG